MWNVTIKGLLAHKLRLALTAIAIVLGVTFISGTFVLTDTLHNTFNTLFGNIYQNINYQIRGVAQFSSGGNAVRNPIPESILPTVRRLPGVEAADGSLEGYAQFVSHDGTPISSGGAPTIGLSFDPDPRISELRLVQGDAPTNADQVVMDQFTANKYHFKVGDSVKILFESVPSRTFTISGIAKFGTTASFAGATLAGFTVPNAQTLFDEPAQYDDINVVTSPGANKSSVEREIQQILPHGTEVVTGQTVVNEQTSSIDQSLSVLSTALLVFAFISLFVGAFTILNTFSIIVGQRTRELALLRTVGASRRQVFRSVLLEAALVGLVSSIIGIALGFAAADGLVTLLRAFGINLPSGGLVFEPRTAIVGLAVGVGVTVIAAISPARRAVRIPPVAALVDVNLATDVSFRRRFGWGGSLAALGALCLGVGLSKPTIGLVGVGALVLFVGVAMLAPGLARPLAKAIGTPLAAVFGMPGRLGRENSMRSPRRTAQTASALMVGLALVSAIAVFGASLSRSTTASVDDAVRADLIVSNSTNSGSGNFSDAIPKELATLPGVTSSTTVYGGQFEFRQSIESLQAVTTTDLLQNVNVHMTSGSLLGGLDAGDMLIDASTATSDHLVVGDRVPVKFAFTGTSSMRIGGIYQSNAVVGSYLVSDAFYLFHFRDPLPGGVLLQTSDPGRVQHEVSQVLRAYPNVQVQTRSQFEKSQTQQVTQLLGIVYALLALAILIALIGIVNTLMLSVFERTHEIGLLRAVGMKRRQIRSMIRTEAVILAVFGALIGIVIGTGLGVALVSGLRNQNITQTVVPIPSLIIFLVIAAILGLIAASWPARRAAKLDVLAAIATH